MYPTKYHKPASISEAVAALSSGKDAMLLAGGQTLIGTMKNHLAAPSDLVDIRQIEGMSGVTSEGDTLRIGAATTHSEVAANAEVKRLCPALACSMHPQRPRATPPQPEGPFLRLYVRPPARIVRRRLCVRLAGHELRRDTDLHPVSAWAAAPRRLDHTRFGVDLG